MKIHTLLLTAAALAPTLSLAANTDASLDACAKAFASDLAHENHSVVVQSVRQAYDSSPRALGSNELLLEARNVRNNQQVARVLCTVNASNEVVNLQPVASDSL
jgi:hypothetical protein